MASVTPFRSWCFTWNNYPPTAFDALTLLRKRPKYSMTVLAVGAEIGASGTPHLQGYCVFDGSVRLTQLKTWLPGTIHWEKRRGTEQEAIDYTRKENSPDRLDWDDRAMGHRTDLDAVAAHVALEPVTAVHRAATAFPKHFIRYHAGIAALSRALLVPTPLIVQRSVRWFHGPTRAGKSFTACNEASALAGSDANVFLWSTPNLKFTDYSGQEFVVLDELRTNWDHFSFAALLSLLGRTRHTVETKGGFVPWRAMHIWITAPVPPKDFACLVGDPIEQLLGRIQEVRHFPFAYEAPAFASLAICPGTPPTLPFPVSDSEVESRPRRRRRIAREPACRAPPTQDPVDLTQDADDCLVI